ncbi:MAG TPA: Gfo/Idh/MocA family oxidoreductase [Gemmatimonadaceae bacterium]|nr:Gfo/Idh/MocA family oxidoreductase [Gemmatimonadaceae bacterium]
MTSRWSSPVSVSFATSLDPVQVTTKESSDAVRVGVIGCGALARAVHLPLLSRMRDVRIVALADPDASARDAAAFLAPHATLHEEHRSLLAQRIDAVVIASPPGMHMAQSVAAFERGVNVYLEKPLASSLAEGDEIVAAWKESRAVGMIGFNYRFNPLLSSLKRDIAAGKVGRIIAVRSAFSIAVRPMPTWKQSRSTGGGVLLDLASHHVDLVRFLLGEDIAEASARLQSIRAEGDTAFLELETRNGVRVQSFFSLSATDQDTFEIFGDRGRLVVDRMSSLGVQHLPASSRMTDRINRLGQRAKSVRNAGHIIAKLRSPMHEPSFRLALDHFISAVRGTTTASPDIDDGYAALHAVVQAENASVPISGAAAGLSNARATLSPV